MRKAAPTIRNRVALFNAGTEIGKTGNDRALSNAGGICHIRCRFPALQKLVLGTANPKYGPQASMRK